MISVFIAAAVSIVGQPAAYNHTYEREAWGEFSRSLFANPLTVKFGTLPDKVRGQPVYWAERWGFISETTDSLKCPALTMVVKSIESVPVPKPAARAPQVFESDATIYSLTVPYPGTNLNKLTITAGEGPVADWVRGAFKKLDGCWLRKRP